MSQNRNRKRILVVALVLIFTMLIGGSFVLARVGTITIDITYRNIQLVINGEQVVVPEENEPFIYGGRTYVPLRIVSEALGYEVGWDDAASTVSIGGENDEPCPGCWNYQPTDMKPNPGWENINMDGLTREELIGVLGCPPHVIRMTSVIGADNNRELWVYHPYDQDPTGLYIWLKGEVFHDSTLNEFNGFACYEMTNLEFWE